MSQLLTIQELKDIENRLDFLSSVSTSQDVNLDDVEREIDLLISLLIAAKKKARINEIGLRVVS